MKRLVSLLVLLAALVGCSAPTPAERMTQRHEGPVTVAVTLLETAQGVLGRAEFTVAAGTNVHAYSETEFSNGEHEAFFRLEDGRELSTRVPDLTGPTTKMLTLGPLPPGSANPCYSLEFAVSRADKVLELLELSGCVRDVSE